MLNAFRSIIFWLALCFPIVYYVQVEANYSDEPVTKAQLGEKLFFDPVLSKDSSVSCASCHKPEFAFADNLRVSFGVDSIPGKRNTPSAMNVASREFFFWDGRASSLEEQALVPIENPDEMNLPVAEAVKRLNRNENYKKLFLKIYGKTPDRSSLAESLAAFERTLETSDSPFDKYAKDNANAISESAKRGQIIFNEKGKCFDCHFGPDFTGDEFRNIALFDNVKLKDEGRYAVTKDSSDLGRFKVPGLRNVAVTAPYMHNGIFKTLREVIDYYDTPDKFVQHSINKDSLLEKPLNLSEQEKQDLEAFLNSLTDQRFTSK